jgi:hypothetical protein
MSREKSANSPKFRVLCGNLGISDGSLGASSFAYTCAHMIKFVSVSVPKRWRKTQLLKYLALTTFCGGEKVN